MSFYDWFFLEKGRTPEGLFSWQHLVSVTVTFILALGLAYFLGRSFVDNKRKQRLVMIVAGFLILAVQISKIAYLLHESTDTFWNVIIGNAPLYLCDLQIFIIPLAAITKGRFQKWCLDFVAIWGIMMGFMGTYFAGNIYPVHCVIGFAAINSLLNHLISAFASMFVLRAKMAKLEKRDIPFVIGILVFFMTVALVIDYIRGSNFMFFFDGGGTPFTIFLKVFGGALVPYQISIYVLQCGYMGIFYLSYYGLSRYLYGRKAKLEEKKEESN